jgi:hypothetical protein
VPSVIALLEFREARAREELESWLKVVREAEEHAAAARQRLEHARIACGEVLRVLAEQAESVAAAARSRPRAGRRIPGPRSPNATLAPASRR